MFKALTPAQLFFELLLALKSNYALINAKINLGCYFKCNIFIN